MKTRRTHRRRFLTKLADNHAIKILQWFLVFLAVALAGLITFVISKAPFRF